MDSNSRLDYALFQLTPTRTRCDLLICGGGGKTEKLASGLLEPFISHVKFAKDEISKGGYSITIRPPSSYHDTLWFTKSTFQRFVRFVSTPEVLERFVSIEKEIIQLEDSIQCSEPASTNAEQINEESALVVYDPAKKSTESPKLKGENEGNGDVEPEENSKIRLKRLLKTRKVLLRKDQGMAYARALAAGFDLNGIDDLISFADTFGASRLRQACINFKELCKKKHADSVWMDELAAMKAVYSPSELSYLGTPAILLSSENSVNGQDPSTKHASSDNNKDVNIPTSDQAPGIPQNNQMPMPWANQIPPYMYNFQNQNPQMPPSGGYPYPVNYPVPPFYPGQMQWHPSMGHTGHSPAKPPSRKKEKSSKVSESTEEDTPTESDSNSDTNSDSNTKKEKKHSSDEHGHTKKSRKKSSRQVVIRNINYITSANQKDGLDKNIISDVSALVGDETFDGKLTSRNGSAESYYEADLVRDSSIGENKNESWNAFQNLLMRNEEESDTRAIDMGSEKFTTRKVVPSDSFIASETNRGNDDARKNSEYFENGDAYRSSMKKGGFTGEEMLMSRRFEGLNGNRRDTISDCDTEVALIKIRKEEDWFVADRSEKPENGDKIIADKLFGEYKKKSREFVDDSFMIHSQSVNNDRYDPTFRTDISMVLDSNLAPENATNSLREKNGASPLPKSDDLYMLPERDSGLESGGTYWTPQMDYEVEKSLESDKRLSTITPNDNADEKLSDSPSSKKKEVGKKEGKPRVSPGAFGRNRPEVKSRQPLLKARTIVQKSKFEKEEEARKKMEELAIQRQKRIAERSSGSGNSTSDTSKKVPSRKPIKI